MQNQTCINMIFQNMHKHVFYMAAQICIICLNMHEGKYAIICKLNLKYA